MSLNINSEKLQNLLDIVNALPDAGSGGVELPTLSNPASEAEIFSGYETIDAEGNVKTGTFTIDSELSTQDDLIAQIQTALENKASGTALPSLSNPATAENLEEGYQLIDGDGNVVTGTHVCSGGSDGNISYFMVQNNLPEILYVNSVLCMPETSTPVPYDTTVESGPVLFATPALSEDYVVEVYYTEIYEGENGEMIEEGAVGGACYELSDVIPFYFGILANFCPGYIAVNNTITFEVVS